MIRLPENYRPAPDLLHGRVVLVSGAGAGVGRAAAEAFGTHGATVVLLGRTVAKLESVYDAIVAAGGPRPAIYPMDLAGALPEHYEELAVRVKDELGRLDGLLHSAALLGTLTPLAHYDPRLWMQVMQVNLNAPFLLTRACLPLLLGADDASIVFTTCLVGHQARAYWGAYGVSKFGLEGLMRMLAQEVEALSGIRVNAIDPGPVRTRLRATAFPGEDPAVHPAPTELTAAWLYLMGPASAELNGETLAVQ